MHSAREDLRALTVGICPQQLRQPSLRGLTLLLLSVHVQPLRDLGLLSLHPVDDPDAQPLSRLQFHYLMGGQSNYQAHHGIPNPPFSRHLSEP